jgi:hypothetical protein
MNYQERVPRVGDTNEHDHAWSRDPSSTWSYRCGLCGQNWPPAELEVTL